MQEEICIQKSFSQSHAFFMLCSCEDCVGTIPPTHQLFQAFSSTDHVLMNLFQGFILFQGKHELQDWKHGRQQMLCLCSPAVQECIFAQGFLGSVNMDSLKLISLEAIPWLRLSPGYGSLPALAERGWTAFPRLLFGTLSRTFKPADLLQQTTQEVTVEPLAK